MVNSCQFLILKKNCVGWFNPHWWHFPMSSVGQKLQPSHRHGRVGHLAARGIFLASLRIGSQAMTLLKPNPGMDGMDAMVSMCCFWRSIGLFKRMFLLVEMTNDPKTMVEADKNLRKLPEVNWDFSPFFGVPSVSSTGRQRPNFTYASDFVTWLSAKIYELIGDLHTKYQDGGSKLYKNPKIWPWLTEYPIPSHGWSSLARQLSAISSISAGQTLQNQWY